MRYLLCSWSLSSLQHLLSFRCLFHYGSSLPGVKALFFLFLIPCSVFTWMLFPFSPALSALAELIWAWSHLQSRRLDFLSLVCVSLFLLHKQRFITLKESRQQQQRDTHSSSSCTKPLHLWVETKSGNPDRSALCALLFILHFLIIPLQGSFSGLCSACQELDFIIMLDVNKSWGNNQQCKHHIV